MKLKLLLRGLQLRRLHGIIASLIWTCLLLLHEDVDLVLEAQDVLPQNTILLLDTVIDFLELKHVFDVG